jgi:hypothetical protein
MATTDVSGLTQLGQQTRLPASPDEAVLGPIRSIWYALPAPSSRPSVR